MTQATCDITDSQPNLREMLEETFQNVMGLPEMPVRPGPTARGLEELHRKYRILCEKSQGFENLLASERFRAVSSLDVVSYDVDQCRIFIYLCLGKYLRLLRNTLKFSQKKTYLSTDERARLVYFIDSFSRIKNEYEHTIAIKDEFNLQRSTLLDHIGVRKLVIPLHITIEPDDTGYYLQCLETPQIYGFGESIKDAMSMFSRQFILAKSDLNNENKMSYELFCLKLCLNLILK